jgi:hypothetical protein
MKARQVGFACGTAMITGHALRLIDGSSAR